MWVWVSLGRYGAHSLGRTRPTNTKQHIPIAFGLRMGECKGPQYSTINAHYNMLSNHVMLVMYVPSRDFILLLQTSLFFLALGSVTRCKGVLRMVLPSILHQVQEALGSQVARML